MDVDKFNKNPTDAQDEYIEKMETLSDKHKKATDAFYIWLGIFILLGMIVFDMSELSNLLIGVLAIPVLYASVQLIQYKNEINQVREAYFATARERLN